MHATAVDVHHVTEFCEVTPLGSSLFFFFEKIESTTRWMSNPITYYFSYFSGRTKDNIAEKKKSVPTILVAKQPRRSEDVTAQKCYLYRTTRPR